jgi:hypothetical protein
MRVGGFVAVLLPYEVRGMFMSEWSDRVAPQAANLLAHDARDGANYLSQQIQEMQRTGHGREALELVDKTRRIESRMPQDQYSGHISTSHQEFNNGWIYENVAVNGQNIASIPERPRDCEPGAPFRRDTVLPDVIIAAGIAGIIGGLMHRGMERNYYEERGREREHDRDRDRDRDRRYPQVPPVLRNLFGHY